MVASIVQVIPHRLPGGMQEVCYALDRGLNDAGLPSRIIDLATMRESSRSRAAMWLSLQRSLRHERPMACLAHSVLGAVFVLTAAVLAGVHTRMLVIHTSAPHTGRLKRALITAMALTKVANEIVCVGENVCQSFGWRRRLGRWAVIHNGIRLPDATQAPLATPQIDTAQTLHIVTAARLVPVKNLQCLIRAAALCAHRVQVTLLGDGEDRSMLEGLAEQLSSPVRFAGGVSRDEVNAWFSRAQVFALTSLDEGLPLVLIEAAAAGLAVVCSDRAFSHEVLGQAGLYCDPEDPEAWARAFDRLASEPELLARLRAAGLERATLFTEERMVEQYVALLQSVR